MDAQQQAMHRLNIRTVFMLKDAGLLADNAAASGDAEALKRVKAVEAALKALNVYAANRVAAMAAEEGK